ncbi:MAG: helix-turn-helix domain-containing protein [Candidatus Nanoarchaeia archaeon]|nr:helix-turn-helix domain-containing protein [Candidatus Nanoarchaeia archaeon]MDD5741021.1 helix-turn-helix domain-containing protein [Candidatus Nanoarchaeia archaeon]
MENKYVSALREYGLSENEIQVYVILLKAGESSVQTIAKNAEIPRTTTYHILTSLQQKGLVGYAIKEHIKYFQATRPEILRDILNDKKKHIEEALPELKSIALTLKQKPEVEIFEGVKGIKSILMDVLEVKKEILHYGDIISLTRNLEYIFPQYISERVRRKIPIRIIAKREKEHDELIKNASKEYRQFKFLPGNFIFKTSVFIYKDKVAILNLQEEPYYGIIITNKDYNNTEKQVFELLWKLAKK